MANTQYVQGSIATTAGPVVISFTPSFDQNLTVVGIFFDTNSGVGGVTATHSVDGALTTELPLVNNSGSMVLFSGVNMTAGDITITWSGGAPFFSFALSVEGGVAVRESDSAKASSGAISLGLASAISGDDILGFFGARFATTISTSDTQVAIDTTSGANCLVTYDSFTEGYTVDVTSDGAGTLLGALAIQTATASPSFRKGSQFDVETTLAGTVTSATLNGAAITVDSQAGATVTLTDSDGSITTSGEYDLVLTDDSADPDETITVQVNVIGVAPSNNPLQKDGAALASLTDVEVRVTAGANLSGSELYYSGTATTDASGNLGNIDLSSTNADDADPVLLSIRTAAGDSIVATETVGIL